MNLLPIDSIIVPADRQRLAFTTAKLDELRSTVQKFLIHPITVRSLDDPTLIAGERRLRVIKAMAADGIPVTFMGETLPLGMIPVLPFNQEDAFLIYEAELVENIHRADLTWQESALALAKYHELQVAKNPTQTLSDTAVQVLPPTVVVTDHQKKVINETINLGRAIENDYELATAKTQKDAMKIIKKRQQMAERTRLASAVSVLGSSCDLRQGDSFELIKTLADASVDVIVTDPPYGADMDKKGTWTVDNHDYDDSGAFVQRMLRELPEEMFRVMKPDSHAYVFCDWRYFDQWAVALGLAGFRVWQRPIIWYKGTVGAFVDAAHGPRYTYECLIYAMKGDRHIDAIYDDVVTVQQSTRHLHPAGKPAELFEFFLKRSALPGQTALDLFGGGGPMIEAAHNCKLSSVVFELSDEYFTLCKARLGELK